MRVSLSDKFQYDLAVVGSGFAGSLMAMIARQQGQSVVLLERGTHPRFAIGESSTPLSNLLLEEISSKYDLPEIRGFTKWGVWQDSHPEVGCGLKRGFSFFYHEPGQAEPMAWSRDDELLVAASPRDRIADTHWYRSDLDWFLVRQAQKLGAEYLDQASLTECVEDSNGVTLRGTRQNRDIQVDARFVVDATGPRGFLHHALGLRELLLPGMPDTQILYSHFTDVDRLRQARWADAPYPVESAAVHHVFPGGWVWLLRFNNGVTSAGVVATVPLAERWGLREGRQGWERMLDDLPVLRRQFGGAKSVQPFRHIARPQFRSASIVGRRWALLPSAAGFSDPLLSTGFPVTLLGISRLAEVLSQPWEGGDFHESLKDYARFTDDEIVLTARLIGALYANMGNFRLFADLTLLYFAASSYSEAAHRLGKLDLAPGFLLHGRPGFNQQCDEIFSHALSAPTGARSAALRDEVMKAIEPIDVAGFTRRDRHNWYPVEADDLFDSVAKLRVSREEASRMLKNCGF